MKFYRTKSDKLAGTDFKEVKKKAFIIYQYIAKNTKRKPYIRSAYFKGEKIFLELFWSHLFEKNYWDRLRRIKFFSCGIELIKKSNFKPISVLNPNKNSEILHRFTGITNSNEIFIVQIKENKRNMRKWLVSIFPKT